MAIVNPAAEDGAIGLSDLRRRFRSKSLDLGAFQARRGRKQQLFCRGDDAVHFVQGLINFFDEISLVSSAHRLLQIIQLGKAAIEQSNDPPIVQMLGANYT
jgi:hypothetical protein